MSDRGEVVQAVAVLGLGVLAYLAIENIGRGLAGVGKGFADIGGGFASAGQGVVDWASPDPGQSIADSLAGQAPGKAAADVAPWLAPAQHSYADPLGLNPRNPWGFAALFGGWWGNASAPHLTPAPAPYVPPAHLYTAPALGPVASVGGTTGGQTAPFSSVDRFAAYGPWGL